MRNLYDVTNLCPQCSAPAVEKATQCNRCGIGLYSEQAQTLRSLLSQAQIHIDTARAESPAYHNVNQPLHVEVVQAANQHKCPSCAHPTLYAAGTCTNCGLNLTHPQLAFLFDILQQVDYLRANMVGVTPLNTKTSKQDREVKSFNFSVQNLILGLGGLCVSVAAIIFLAVSWNALPIAGRTAILGVVSSLFVGFTFYVAKKKLKGTTETFAALAVALLGFDFVGSFHAGWWGSLDAAVVWVVSGSILVALSVGFGMILARISGFQLYLLQVTAALAWFSTWISATTAGNDLRITYLLLLVNSIILSYVAYKVKQTLLYPAVVVIGGLVYITFTILGLQDALESHVNNTNDFDNLWVLGVSAIVAAIAAFVHTNIAWRCICWSSAAILLTIDLTLPIVQTASTAAIVFAVLSVSFTLIASFTSHKIVSYITFSFAGFTSLIVGAMWFVFAVATWGVFSFDTARMVAKYKEDPFLYSPIFALTATVVLVFILGLNKYKTLKADFYVAASVLIVLPTLLYANINETLVVGAVLSVLLVNMFAKLPHYTSDVKAQGFNIAATILSFTYLTVYLNRNHIIDILIATSILAIFYNAWLSKSTALRVLAAMFFIPANLFWASCFTNLVGLGSVEQAAVVLLVCAVSIMTYLVNFWFDEHPDYTPVGLLQTFLSLLALGILFNTPSGQLVIVIATLGVLAASISVAVSYEQVYSYIMVALWSLFTLWKLFDVLNIDSWEAVAVSIGILGVTYGSWFMVRKQVSSSWVLAPGIFIGTFGSWVISLSQPVSLRALIVGIVLLVMLVIALYFKLQAPLVLSVCAGIGLVVAQLVPYAGSVPQWVVLAIAGILLLGIGVRWEHVLVSGKKTWSSLNSMR